MFLICIGVFALGFITANWLVHRLHGIGKNPYISAHILKDKNETNYKEYLNWLSKRGGVPIPKMRTREDIEAEVKIKNLMK